MLGRFGAGKPEKLAEEAALSLMSYAVCMAVVAFPAALVVAWRTDNVEAISFFACLICYLLSNGVARTALTLLALRGLKLPFFIVESVRSGLGFVAVIGLAVTGTATDYISLATAMNIATGVAAVIGVGCALHGIGLRWPTTWGWDRRSYAIPLMAGTVIGIALNSSDRLITGAFAGPAALATYAAAITLARQPLEFIFSVVNVRTFPELMEAYEKGGAKAGSDRMADLITIMALMALPAAIGLALVADPLARTVLTPAYAETARVVIPLGAFAGTCIGFRMFVFDQPLHMTRTIWRSIFATAPAMLICVCLTAFLVSRFGAVGCVVGVAIQSAAALAISIVLSSKAVPLKIHRDDLARIGLMSACMAVAVTLALAATSGLPAALQLTAGVVAGCVSYGLAGWMLMRSLIGDLLPRRAPHPVEAGQSGASS